MKNGQNGRKRFVRYKTGAELYDVCQSTFAARTYAGYMYIYNAHIRPTLGKRKIKDIKYSDVLGFYKRIMEEDKLCFGSIERLQREIHPVLEHWKPIFTFLLGTGVRVGELSGLRWCNIDFENGFITIDHAVVYFAGKMNKTGKKLSVSTPKTHAGIRKIPLVKEVRKSLEEIKKYQLDNDIFCKIQIDGYTDFIFLNRFGNILLQHDLDRALRRIIEAYNDTELHNAVLTKREALTLPHFTCHSLRHTFCARFCEHEKNLKVIQSVMGHVDIGTTMNIYAEVSDAKKKQSMEALAENLNIF